MPDGYAMNASSGWSDLLSLSALQHWMDQQQLGRGPIHDVVELTGGTQNLLLRFRRDGHEYVLRRPSRHPRPEANQTMRREARLLTVLSTTKVPHPRLIAACDSESVLGTAFYLMENVEGFNACNELPALHRQAQAQHRMGLALVDAALALGELDHEALGLGDFGRPQQYLERQVARWGSQLESYREFTQWPGPASLPQVDRIGDWLQANRPAHFTPGLLHGDFHIGNVLYRHDTPELAAVVDWELATVGDPLIDLGWLLAMWPDENGPIAATAEVQPWLGFPSANELVEHYRAHSSRDTSAIDWYATLACYKLAIILEGSHARACAGKADVATGDKLHRSAVSLFERAAKLIR